MIDHPFVAGMSPAQRTQLDTCAREVHFPQGAFIFHEGEPAGMLFLLHRGLVALEQHVPARGVVQLESLRPGDLLGLSWLFSGERWMLDARAVEPVDATALEGDCLRRLMVSDPALGCAISSHLVQRLYERLVRARLQRLDVYRTER